MQTLRAGGWKRQAADDGFSAGQPTFAFQLPLTGRDVTEVLAGMNQLWRRNIKKAASSGVEVRIGQPADLGAFHALYVDTAARDHFTPRPLGYFQQMFDVMQGEDDDRIRLYLAHHEGDLVAATTMVGVGRHSWYSYGASSTAKRDVRGSNAVQWQMIRDAIAAGATVYDLRGITETLAADDPHIGLIQFKVWHGRHCCRVCRRVGPSVEPAALQGVRALHGTAVHLAMGLELYVDGPRWRAHLRATAEANPGLIPVTKGNGYGFGLPGLARRTAWLACDTIAVGTYHEVADVRQRFAGDIVVLEPWRPQVTNAAYDPTRSSTLRRPPRGSRGARGCRGDRPHGSSWRRCRR